MLNNERSRQSTDQWAVSGHVSFVFLESHVFHLEPKIQADSELKHHIALVQHIHSTTTTLISSPLRAPDRPCDLNRSWCCLNAPRSSGMSAQFKSFASAYNQYSIRSARCWFNPGVCVCLPLYGCVSEDFITDFRFCADRKDKITAIESSFSHSESLANSLCRFSQGNNGSTVVSI